MRALAVGVVVAVALFTCCGGSDDEDGTTAEADPAGASASAETPPVITDLADAGAKLFRMPGDWLSSTTGSVWLSGDAWIKQLDAQTGRLKSETKIVDNRS